MSFSDKNEIAVEFHDREHLITYRVLLKTEIFVGSTENPISWELAQRTDFSFQNAVSLL